MLKRYSLVLLLSSVALFATDAKELLEKNCATCHIQTVPTPDIIPTLKAPAFEAVGYHLGRAIKDKKVREAFVVDYVQNPDASKSVCESNKVQNFGVMPSLKGKVSKEELSKIAHYLVDNFPTDKFVSMINEVQKNGKINQLESSPFLINNSGLPHLTKMLIENWDKAKLGLTKEQKEKLLVVRKDTLGGVKKIKQQIIVLEEQIVEDLADIEDVKEFDKKIDEIANLKAKASKIHLKCIRDTLDTLNDEQIEFLLPLSNF